jgi:hypothetical protein
MPKSFSKFASFAFALLVLGLSSAHAETIRSEKGKFSIEIPGQAKFAQISKRYQWTFEDKRVGWGVSYEDAPGISKRSVKFIYDTLQKALTGDKTSNSRDIQHRRQQGREIIVDADGGGTMRIWNFVVGDRLYTISYTGPHGTEHSREVDAVFASFQLD